MKEKKGKIFNEQEVEAIIAGKKTMFREVVKNQPPHDFKTTEKTIQLHNNIFCNTGENYDFYFGVAPYRVGQKIFCKESFVDFRNNNSDIFYKSDFEINNLVKIADLKWNYARSMKQEQSRLTLKIKSVKVEKLRDISEEDAIAEGIEEVDIPIFMHLKSYTKAWKWYKEDNFGTYCARKSFGNFWDSTHKKQEHKWEANPWVFAYEFEVINN